MKYIKRRIQTARIEKMLNKEYKLEQNLERIREKRHKLIAKLNKEG